MTRLNEIITLAQERAQKLELPYEGALTPLEAAELLQLSPRVRMVDVRTRAEWDWVGRVPGALEIEWQTYPGGVPNPHFLAELRRAVTTESLLLFLCRSGARSSAAAKAATEAGFPDCFNVLEGFEGDKNELGRRNAVNGWRHAGLPWQQS